MEILDPAQNPYLGFGGAGATGGFDLGALDPEGLGAVGSLYRENPYLFTPEAGRQLEALAIETGLQLRRQRAAEEGGLFGVLGQFGAGFVQGATTLPFGEDPDSTLEAVAHNVGSVLGFLGVLPGPGLLGRLGVGTLARTMGLGRAARLIGQAARGPNVLRGVSVPMQVGRVVAERAGAYRTAERFFRGRGVTTGTSQRLADMAEEAVQLGAASAAGSWPQGLDAMLQGAALGAVEGAGMRGIVNFLDLGPLLQSSDEIVRRGANIGARAFSSALYTGLPATVMDAPFEYQVYQYLLGGVFGGIEPDFAVRQAGRYLQDRVVRPSQEGGDGVLAGESPRQRVLNIVDDPIFREQESAVQDEILNQAGLRWLRDVTRLAEEHPDLAPFIAEDERLTSVDVIQAQVLWDAYQTTPAFAERMQALRAEGLSEREAENQIRTDWWQDFDRAPPEAREAQTMEAAGIARASERAPRVQVEAEQALAKEQAEELAPFDPEPAYRLLDALRLDQMRRTLEDHEDFHYLARPLENLVHTVIRDNPHVVEQGGLRPVERTETWTDDRGEPVEVQIERWVTHDGKALSPREVAFEVSTTFMRHRDEGEEGFDAALEELESRWGALQAEAVRDGEVVRFDAPEPLTGLDSRSAAFRQLRQAWLRVGQTFEVPQASYDVRGGQARAVRLGEYDAVGNRVAEVASPSLVDQIAAAGGIEAVRIDRYTRGTDEGVGAAVENAYLSDEVGVFDFILNTDRDGLPFAFGVKDKGKGVHTTGYLWETRPVRLPDADGLQLLDEDGQPTSRPITADEVPRVLEQKLGDIQRAFDAQGTEHAPVRETMNALYARFRDGLRAAGHRLPESEVQALYERQVLHGMQLIEELNGGVPIDVVLSSDGFIQDVATLNKRAQLFEDTSIPAHSRMGEGVEGAEEGWRFAIVNETRGPREGHPTAEGKPPVRMPEVREGELRQYAADHHLDGVFMVRGDAFDKLTEHFGLDPDAGAAKGTVIYNSETDGQGNPLGLMLGKFAYFRADEGVDAGLREQGLHALMYDSAAKQRGLRERHDYIVGEDGALRFYREGRESPNPVDPSVYTIPYEGLRVNMGSSENTQKALRDQKLPKQFLTNLEDEAAIERAMERFIRPSFEGDPEANATVERALAGEDVDVADLDIDDVSIQHLLHIITGSYDRSVPLRGTPLYDTVWRQLLRRTQDDPHLGGDEWNAISETLFQASKNQGGAAGRLLDIAAEAGLIEPAIIHDPAVEPYVMDVFRGYVMDRLLRPRASHSGKTIFQPQDPWLQHRLARAAADPEAPVLQEAVRDGIVQPGYVLLQDGWKAKPIAWIDGDERPLGEAFESYRTLRAQYEQVDGRTQAGRAMRAKLDRMEEALTFAQIRVPADSPSGTRMLRLAGFSGRQGAGAHLHNRDMMYLGGADLDIDSGFLIQAPDGLDTNGNPIRDFYERHADQWDDPEHPGVLTDPKEGTLDGRPLAEVFTEPLAPEEAHPLGMLDPRLKFEVARGAVRGNRSIGIAANAGRYAHELFARHAGQPVRGRITHGSLKRMHEEVRRQLEADPTNEEAQRRNTLLNNLIIRLPDGQPDLSDGGEPRYRPLFFEARVTEDKTAFDFMRRAAMNYFADAGSFAGLRLTGERAARALGAPLLERPRFWAVYADGPVDVRADIQPQLTDTNLGRRLVQEDRLVRGRRPGGEGTYSPWTILHELGGQGRQRAEQGLPPPTNVWYRAIGLLEDLDFRPVGGLRDARGEPVTTGQEPPRQEAVPYIGRAWEEVWRPRINALNARAREGDPYAREVLGRAQRKGIVLDERSETADPALLHQDLADVVTLLHLDEAARAAQRAGISENELASIAERVDRLKADWSRAIRGRSERTRSVLAEEPEGPPPTVDAVNAAVQEARSGLSAPARAYFDAYMLGSLSPQSRSLRAHMDRAEARFYEQPFRRSEQGEPEPILREGFDSDEAYQRAVDRAWSAQREAEKQWWWRTNQSQLAFNSEHVADRAIRRKLEIKSSLARTTREEPLTDAEHEALAPLMRPEYDPGLQDAVEAAGGDPSGARAPAVEAPAQSERLLRIGPHANDLFTQLTDPARGVVSAEEAAENRRLYDRAYRVLTRHPHLIDQYASLFRYVTAEESASGLPIGVDPEVATAADLRDFLQFFDQIERRASFRRILSRAEDGIPVGRFAHYWFPDTIGELHREADLQVSNITVTRPVLTADGIRDEQVRRVYSHMDQVHENTSQIQLQKNAAIEALQAERGGVFAFLDQIPASKRDDLVRAAVVLREFRSIPRLLGKDPERVRLYRQHYAEHRETIERLRDTTFRMTDEDGRIRAVSGRELLGSDRRPGRINRAITEALQRRYNTFIRNHEAERQWLVTDDGRPYDPEGDRPVDPFKSLRAIQTERERTGQIPVIGMEGWLKIHHELYLRTKRPVEAPTTDGRTVTGPLYELARRADVRLTPEQAAVRLQALREQHPLPEIGYVEAEGYWPHNGHPKRVLDEAARRLAERLEEEGAPEAVRLDQKIRLARAYARGALDDQGMSEWLHQAVLQDAYIAEGKDRPMLAPSMRSRGETSLDGYDLSLRALSRYDEQVASAYYKTATAILNKRLIDNFVAEEVMGDKTQAWARWMEMYTANVLGAPSVYPKSWLEDPELNLRESPTFWTSGHQMEELARSIDEKLGTDWFSFQTDAGRVESQIGDARSERFQAMLKHLSQLDAKWNLMSLLASTRGMANNLVGGTTQTIISAGWKPFLRAGSLRHLQRINPDWGSWDDVNRSMEDWGIIESFLVSEAQQSAAFQGGRMRAFFEEARAHLRDNPDAPDQTLIDIARRHGLTESIFDGAAWFMRSVERRLRRRAALAHYLKAREMFEAHGHAMPFDHPWLIRMAQKGVEATQFLYDAANRPTFSSTDMGRLLTRFQLWAWNSVRFRRDVLREARAMGYVPGSLSFERFKRMATTDLFVFALAGLFPASLFENVMPQPWGWLQDLADWLFGDEEERERAFFGTLPYPLNIAQAVSPPSARVPMSMFGALLSGDWDRFASYHVWSWFPFGLQSRAVYNTVQSPVMATEQLTGFPLHRIHRTLQEERAEPGVRGAAGFAPGEVE